ncbi:GNAT family N-acetyltransferase [Jatrophihabitans sp.]|uniref:GNAT family N-acetyltransferase n=1 Tax=Jatrophihabitans sp. TaxID=1932789 RepID=UPI002EEF3A0B
MITTSVYRDIADVPAEEWDLVVERTGAPVFYRHAYLSAHARTAVTSAQAQVLVIARDGSGDPVAICPASLQSPSDPLGALAQHVDGYHPSDLSLLSHNWQCYDTRLPAIDHGAAPRIVETLHEVAVEAGASWFGFVNVADGPQLAALAAAGFDVAEVDERFCLDLHGIRTIEDYLERLRPSARRNLRRYRLRAQECGVTVENLAVRDVDLDEAVALIRHTAARHGTADFYRDGPFQDFLRSLGELVTTIRISDADRLLAVGFCLPDRDRFHMWTCGAVYQHDAAFSPYGLLFLETVRSALASGRPILEGGRRNREYKERHGLHRVPLHAALRRLG